MTTRVGLDAGCMCCFKLELSLIHSCTQSSFRCGHSMMAACCAVCPLSLRHHVLTQGRWPHQKGLLVQFSDVASNSLSDPYLVLSKNF